MKKTLLFLIALFITTIAFAKIEIDGIYYNLNNENKTAEVTYEDHYYDNYSSVTTLTIPSSVTYNSKTYNVTSIGTWAFKDCSSLTSITIPNSVTEIGTEAFLDCTSLTSITIPNSVTEIGTEAFLDCTSLTSITIPNSVTSIGELAFYNCSSLTSITIPNSVTSIGGYAFFNTPWLNNQPDGCIYINNLLYTYKGEMPANTHIDVKEGTTQICAWAFDRCSSLTSITIPNSITEIGERAFRSCYSLTSITIPNSVTSIGDYAFVDCSSLSSITIGNNVTSIGESAFYGCSSLTSITIPNSVTSIGDDAFYNCSSLTSISIPNSVTSIGSSAFYNCSSLKSIQWNAKNCTDFTSYSESPFYSINYKITSFTFGDSVQYIPAYLCYQMSKLTSITIPNSVTSIGNWAFSGCYSVTSISIGNGITSIDDEMFLNFNKLRTIKLGNSIETIGKNAFKGCSALYSFEILTKLPPIISSSTFTDVSRTMQVKVPCSAVADYQASNYWNEFTNFVENPYTLTAVANDETMGVVTIIKQPTCQDITSQIVAQPLPGYEFVKWSDGFTENPHTIYVTDDTTITAEFRVASTPIENTHDSNISIFTTDNTLHIDGITTDYQIYNTSGQLVYSGNASTLSLPRGIYLVTINGETQKIVL